jgi:hypothetical protein
MSGFEKGIFVLQQKFQQSFRNQKAHLYGTHYNSPFGHDNNYNIVLLGNIEIEWKYDTAGYVKTFHE